jgi:hypothetical protein
MNSCRWNAENLVDNAAFTEYTAACARIMIYDECQEQVHCFLDQIKQNRKNGNK